MIDQTMDGEAALLPRRQPLRVLQIMGNNAPGGAENFFVRFLTAAQDRPHDFEMQAMVRRGSWIEAQLKKCGLYYRSARFGGWFDWRTRLQIRDHVENFRPDIVQCWMGRAARHLPSLDIPTLARIGGYYHVSDYRGRVDWLVFIAESIRDRMVAHGWPAERATVIHNFADPPPPDFARERDEMRARLGIAPDRWVLLVAGRFHRVKGIDLALDALVRLPADTHLLLVGAGPEEANIRARAEAPDLRGRVSMVGWVPSVTPYAAASDVWLYTSRSEPFGTNTLDAWAHGLPVVASRTGGPAGVIEHGVDGLLYDIEDVTGMVAALRLLHGDRALAARMATAGREKLSRDFSRTHVLDRYLDFYRACVREHCTTA